MSEKYDFFDVRKKPTEVQATGPFYRETVVETLEGDFEVDHEYAENGFYIIKGVDGELYPCRGDIFKETYETSDGDEIECSEEDCDEPVDPRNGYCCLEHEVLDVHAPASVSGDKYD